MRLAAVLLGGAVFAAGLAAARISLAERKRRAAAWFAGLGLAGALPPVAAALFSPSKTPALVVVLAYLAAAAVLVFPIDPKRRDEGTDPGGRFDERDTMFSRKELVPGTIRFEEYYARHPEKRTPDDGFRARPGLLSARAALYDAAGFAAAEASFAAVKALHPLVEGGGGEGETPAAAPSNPNAAAENSRFIKAWALALGAHSAGIAALRDYHFYSHGGRADRYGRVVDVRHPFAVAFTVEMDPEMIDEAPFAPVVMESARQYVKAWAIAVQLAETIRRRGAQARAHIDGNYLVVCPLVARDAGLGEIGRMGLLMTPQAGPRVRIAVVTTDWPLVADRPTRDGTVIDFCRACRKCADACPARAIPRGNRSSVDGALRWRIDAEACFTYWCAAGTDCGVCIKVCPFSHRNNFLHRVIRSGVRKSFLFRRLTVPLDGLFYGKRIKRGHITYLSSKVDK